MKKYISLSTSIIILLVVPFAFSAQTKESTPQKRQKTFDQVWKIVNEKFFDPQFGGVNWNEVRTRYSPLVAATKSDAEFYELLNKMLAELHTSHFEVGPPQFLKKSREPLVTTGLALREVEGQVVVWRVAKASSAEEANIRPGFVIKTIDDAPIDNLEDALQKLSGKLNTMTTIGLLDGKDQMREAALERRLMPLTDIVKQDFGDIVSLYALYESRRLRDNIGYLRFTSFITPLRKWVRATIESMHDAPGIIIDLRGNGGGDDSVALEMANAFFRQKTQLMITRRRKGDDNYYAAKPNKNSYSGKVVILLDQDSASASEQFAAGMQEAGRATVIGKKSGGEDMDADITLLATGALFLYVYGQPRTPKGVIIEGRGVIPDIDVNLSRKDLLAGKDSQLEAAIEFVLHGTK